MAKPMISATRVPNKNQCKECHSLGGEIVPIGPKARNFILDPAAFGQAAQPLFRKSGGAQAGDAAVGRSEGRGRCRACPRLSGRQLRALSQSRGQRVEQRAVPALDRRSRRRQLRYRQAPDRRRGSGGMDFAIAPGDPDHELPDLSSRKHRPRYRDARGSGGRRFTRKAQRCCGNGLRRCRKHRIRRRHDPSSAPARPPRLFPPSASFRVRIAGEPEGLDYARVEISLDRGRAAQRRLSRAECAGLRADAGGRRRADHPEHGDHRLARPHISRTAARSPRKRCRARSRWHARR